MASMVRVVRVVVVAAVAFAVIAVVPRAANAGYIESNCTVRYGGPVLISWGFNDDYGAADICVNGRISNMAGNGSGSGTDSLGTPALYFPLGETGGGERVWDNAASAWNMDTAFMPRIWEHPGFWGASITLAYCCDYGSNPYSLGSVTNKNSSLNWTG